MSGEVPDLSIILPCFNRAHDLARVLNAFDQQSGWTSFELIAVDDGSTDGTYELLSTYQPTSYSLQVVRQERNQGPAAARNAGISQAKSPIVLFAGDDILPDRYLVSGHLAAHRYYPGKEIAVLGKVIWPKDMPVNTLMAHIDGIGAQQFSYHYLRTGMMYDFRHFYTANVSVKRELLTEQDKWFDTDFPYAAFEDTEFSYRLSQAGMKIIYLEHLLGYHYHYHTIWTFSIRQFRAGMMACHVVKKQPGSRNLVLGRRWKLRLLRLQWLSVLKKPDETAAAELESQALHLASQYEWKSHPALDRFYLGLLYYFFYKGTYFWVFFR